MADFVTIDRSGLTTNGNPSRSPNGSYGGRSRGGNQGQERGGQMWRSVRLSRLVAAVKHSSIKISCLESACQCPKGDKDINHNFRKQIELYFK